MPWVKIGLGWLGVGEGGITQNIPWNTLFIGLNTGELLNFWHSQCGLHMTATFIQGCCLLEITFLKSRTTVTVNCFLNTVNSRLADTLLQCITDTPIIRTAVKIFSKNKLQRFDRNKLPLLWTLTNWDTNLRSLQCPL